MKGLFGGYLATFSLEPYYDLTKKYGDIEHRDIWEYELDFSQTEVDRALDFVWEVGNTYVDYFFFDENCSLYVLATLEYARPSLHLIDQFGYYVIPTDTLRVLNSEKQLVRAVQFRPSLTSRLEEQAVDLSREEISLAKSIASGKKSIQEVDVSPKLAEFSFDYLEYLSSAGKVEGGEARRISMEILRTRSELEEMGVEESALRGERPDRAHASSRFSVGVGNRDGSLFSEFHIHPAYHDSLDPPLGLTRGQSIQFFDLKFRQYESDNFELTSFYPIAIESFAPMARVFSPLSWNFLVGSDRQMIPADSRKNEKGSMVGVLQGGVGKTYRRGDFSFSALLDLRATGSPAYEEDRFAFGLGPVLKSSLSLCDDFRANLSFSSFRMGLGETHSYREFSLGGQYDLNSSSYLRSGFSHVESFNREYNEVVFSLGSYF